MVNELSNPESGVDFDARYTVDGYRGVAFYLNRYATKSVPVTAFTTVDDDGEYDPDGREVEVETDETEEIEDRDWVIAIMVGDDREHVVEVTDLTKLDDLDYCHECGQIGCQQDGRSE